MLQKLIYIFCPLCLCFYIGLIISPTSPVSIVLYLFIYVWLAVPGMLVGWLLHRFWHSGWSSALGVLVAAEAFTLLPVLFMIARFGFTDAKEMFFLTHYFLFVPMLIAISSGYIAVRVISGIHNA